MANPTVLDSYNQTPNGLVSNPTVSAGSNRNLLIATYFVHSVAAVGYDSMTYGDQSMTLVGEGELNDRSCCIQLWVLREAQLAVAVGTNVAAVGGTYDTRASLDWTLQDAHQGKINFRSDVETDASGNLLLGRKLGSWTFSTALSETATNIPVLSNPAASANFTFTNGTIAYGDQNDVDGLALMGWSLPVTQESAQFCCNFRLAPSAFAAVDLPETIRIDEIRYIPVEGAQEGLTEANFSAHLDDGSGPQGQVVTASDNGGGDYVLGVKFDQSVLRQVSATGYPLYISDGTNNFTTAAIPYLPHFNETFVDIVSPNASSEIYLQYTDRTPVAGDQWVFEKQSNPDNEGISVDSSLNTTIATTEKDQFVKGRIIDASGNQYAVQYIVYAGTVADTPNIFADYLFNDANVAGQEPNPVKDWVNSNNDLTTTNYGSGGIVWGENRSGRYIDKLGGGVFALFYSATAPIFADLDSKTTFSIELLCDPTAITDAEGRAFHIGTTSGEGDLVISPAGASFAIGWDRETGGENRTVNYPSLVDKGWAHIVLNVDTAQAVAADRIQVFVNGAKQAPIGGSTYPTLNATLNTNQTGRSTVFGNRAGGGASYQGKIARCRFRDCALTPAQVRESATRLYINNDIPYGTPVTVDYDEINPRKPNVEITGTSNTDYGFPSIQIDTVPSGTIDNYNAIVRGGKFEIRSNPFAISKSNVFPLIEPNYIYTNPPGRLRLNDDRLLFTAPRRDRHAGTVTNDTKIVGRLSSDDVNFGPEFDMWIGDNTNYAIGGGSGITEPATGEMFMIMGEGDTGDVTGKSRRLPEWILKGSSDATTFTREGYYSDQDFQESRSTAYKNGWPLSIAWSLETFNGKTYTANYGINQAWILEWDEINKTYTNKQLLFDIPDSLGYGLNELAFVKVSETQCLFIIRNSANETQFVVRCEITPSGKFQMIDDISDLINRVQFAETMTAGCSFFSMPLGDDSLIVNGARNPVFEITARRWYRKDIWQNPHITCNLELKFQQLVVAKGTATTSGSNADFGMPRLFPAKVEGEIPTYTCHVVWYDTDGQLIPGDPFQHHKTEAFHSTFPVWEA